MRRDNRSPRFVVSPRLVSREVVANPPLEPATVELANRYRQHVTYYRVRRLWRQAHGCDLFGLMPKDVLRAPLSDEELEDSEGPEQALPLMPQDVTQLTEEPLKDAVLGVRKELGKDYPVGVYLQDFFKNAMQGERSADQALVHTSYFSSPDVRKSLVSLFKNEPVELPRLEETPATTPPVDARQSQPTMYDFAAWCTRSAIIVTLFLLPIVAVHATNWFVFYRHSGAFYLRAWRVDDELLRAKLRPFAEAQLPEHVRWGVYATLMEEFGLASPTQLIEEVLVQNQQLQQDAKSRMEKIRQEIRQRRRATGQAASRPPAGSTAGKDDPREEFLDDWSVAQITDDLQDYTAPWMQLVDTVSDVQLAEITHSFDAKSRLEVLKSWLDKSTDKELDSLKFVELLTYHARICWRSDKHRPWAREFLKVAEDRLNV